MNPSTLLFLLLILACPLMMIFMMRGHGGHGQGGHSHGCHGGGDRERPKQSLQELRRRRAKLDALIEQREAEEADRTPVLAGNGR